MRRFWFRRGLRFLGFAILFVGLAGLVVMALWNALLPAIFGVTTINWLQALGLLVLSRILFGGPRGFGGGGFGPGRHEWRQKMADRWKNMTPEQQEEMRQQWRNRCGRWGRGRWEREQSEETSETKSTTAL
ncbi:hypothetical protein [Spirosoma oryzicola]|uniref:hypothetical protein n=1 Tax=Spirosoma oryzicola TaxID=2898794 RepID=UPI001E4BBEFA|nr:hypothetical protein [Spirosoma oryzicola]UHG91850.1 hypothetical protein LQ777_02870 [Spirosoma oryzicola]